MAFHFTLGAVLRYRRSLEEREELRLQTLLASRAAVLEELQQAATARRRRRSAIADALHHSGVPAAELHFSTAQLNGIAERQQALRSRLSVLENNISEQTIRYRRERQNREVLESLRERQLRDYRVVEQRRQQLLLDELHRLRAARRRA